jgi:hypothetical protein
MSSLITRSRKNKSQMSSKNLIINGEFEEVSYANKNLELYYKLTYPIEEAKRILDHFWKPFNNGTLVFNNETQCENVLYNIEIVLTLLNNSFFENNYSVQQIYKPFITTMKDYFDKLLKQRYKEKQDKMISEFISNLYKT